MIKTRTLMLSLLFVLLAAVPASAQELHYWGLVPGQEDTGVIELGGQTSSVRAGDDVLGWGTVEALSAQELVLRRDLSDAERDALEAEGKAVYDAKEIHVRNLQGLLPQVPTPPR
jgi:hypothetical protein